MGTQTGFIVDCLPEVPARRYDVQGATLTIERQNGARVIVERQDGRLVEVHHADRADDDSGLVNTALWLEYKRDAVFMRDTLRLPACPAWCNERHYDPEDEHLGPGASLDAGIDTLMSISVEQQPGGVTRAVFIPIADRMQPVSLASLRDLYENLPDVIAVLEAEEAQDAADGPR